jgi:hypothetical protein
MNQHFFHLLKVDSAVEDVEGLALIDDDAAG